MWVPRPNALSRPMAIAGEMPARPFTISESCLRLMPRCLAASVTFSPRGAKQSCRTERPEGQAGRARADDRARFGRSAHGARLGRGSRSSSFFALIGLRAGLLRLPDACRHALSATVLTTLSGDGRLFPLLLRQTVASHGCSARGRPGAPLNLEQPQPPDPSGMPGDRCAGGGQNRTVKHVACGRRRVWG